MIVTLKDQQINHHFGIGPYVYLVNDPKKNGNYSFIDRVKTVDLKYHVTQCCQITKAEYKPNNHFSISIKSLEAFVVEKNEKKLSFIDPTESQIEKMYIYVKTKTESKLTNERINILLDIIKTDNFSESQALKIKKDIEELRKIKPHISQTLYDAQKSRKIKKRRHNRSNHLTLIDKESSFTELFPEESIQFKNSGSFRNFKQNSIFSTIKTYSRTNKIINESPIDKIQIKRDMLKDDVG